MLLTVFSVGVLLQATAAPADFDAPSRLDAAIGIARRDSLRTAEVDWTILATRVHEAGDNAADIIDLLPAYVTLTQGLGDNHSFIRPTRELSDGWRRRYGGPLIVAGGPPPLPPPKSAFRQREQIEWLDRVAPNGSLIRRVIIPRMFGGGSQADQYAARLSVALSSDSDRVCGYIIDLRGNGGGNIWPMAAGVSPLFSDGILTWTREPDDAVLAGIELRQGTATPGSGAGSGRVLAQAQAGSAGAGARSRPVAVLLDDGVASSAESLAIAFRDRANTRSFGSPTRGLATVNREHDLGDGVTLGIASAWMADKAGRTFPSGVPVDVAVPEADADADGSEPTERVATEWLSATSACSK